MAKSRTRTFRLLGRDEWALEQARQLLGPEADHTGAFRWLIQLAVEAAVQQGFFPEPYREPGVEAQIDPARLAPPPAAQDSAPERGGTTTPPAPEPAQEIEQRNEKCNTVSPLSVTPGAEEPLPPDADRIVEDPIHEVEAGPALCDDGPDLPEGWKPLEPDEYNVTCSGCGVSGLRWIGPRQPRGLRRLQDRAGTIHNPGACRRRREAPGAV